jgi:propionyl-CoA synthetase
MTGSPLEGAWGKLGVQPGLCADCRYPKLNETRRGTVYLRCTRAEWDAALPRYPRLPVTRCAGFEPGDRSGGAQRGGDLPGEPDE